MDNLTVVGVAGPGDALASFEATQKSLQLIKAEAPEQPKILEGNYYLYQEEKRLAVASDDGRWEK